MLLGSALALWLTLLTLFPQPGDTPTLQPTVRPTPLPKSALICMSAADRATFDDLRHGRCPTETTQAPADVWFALRLPAGAADSVLYTSDIHALKSGELEVSVDGGSPLLLRAFDPIATRPYYDARLAVPLSPARDRPTSVLLRMRILDQRHMGHPEQQVTLVSRVGAQQEQLGRWFWQGAFAGLMLIMALYHAFLWRAERLPAAAWYSLTLMCMTLYFGSSRLLLSLLPFAAAPRLFAMLHPVLMPLLGLCYVQFVRRYAHLTRAADRAARMALIPLAATALVAPILNRLQVRGAAANIVNLLVIAAAAVTLAAAAVSARAGDRESRVMGWSMLPPFLGALIQAAAMAGTLPPAGFPSVAMQAGVTVQVVALGLALSDRIRRLRIDRDQAEAIVRLTLPDKIADRLKGGEKSIADRHAQVAVLFADLAGFTPLSASRDAAVIVRLLDALFSEFDTLAHRVGAEKIKTIGDCYMVVAGAPSPHDDPVGALADLALELPHATARALDHVRALAPDLPDQLPLRVGLHVGPVVAGVLGKQKLAYDLWGDTVNTASRMESHGVIGRVQCTQQVVDQLADRYEFEARGEIAIRGKGSLPVWLLVGKRTAIQG